MRGKDEGFFFGCTPSVTSCENQVLLNNWLIPSLLKHGGVSIVLWLYFAAAVLVRVEGRMNAAKHRKVLEENLLQSTQTQTGVKVQLSVWQWHDAKTISECPLVAQPKLEALSSSVERSEDSTCSLSPYLIWLSSRGRMAGRMGETARIIENLLWASNNNL